jgi:hypothetical protein
MNYLNDRHFSVKNKLAAMRKIYLIELKKLE